MHWMETVKMSALVIYAMLDFNFRLTCKD